MNKFFYLGYWVSVQPSGVCFSALIYKNDVFVGGSYASPLESEDPEQKVIEKAMLKIQAL